MRITTIYDLISNNSIKDKISQSLINDIIEVATKKFHDDKFKRFGIYFKLKEIKEEYKWNKNERRNTME